MITMFEGVGKTLGNVLCSVSRLPQYATIKKAQDETGVEGERVGLSGVETHFGLRGGGGGSGCCSVFVQAKSGSAVVIGVD